MFNSNRKSTLLALTVLGFALSMTTASAQEAEISTVNVSDLPINVANQEQVASGDAISEKGSDTLISPTKAQVVAEAEKVTDEEANPAKDNAIVENTNIEKTPAQNSAKETNAAPQKKGEQSGLSANEPEKAESFDFDLKMKAANQSSGVNSNQVAPENNVPVPNNSAAENVQTNPEAETAEKVAPEMTTTVQYKVSPVEDLGNSVLSQLDDDLFSQMSAIEKSTTLLTLELRREKIRNEIEAQKAIRRKSAEDAERQKAEEKLKELERRKQIEAQVIREQQILADKEKLMEVLKQRKLINAYMNQMLVMQQDWLKEKESLYAQLAQADEDKKAVIASFKQKLDTVLEASAKNMQVAEDAKANFERIIKALKTRNEQLKKRIEADALIIKNAKSSLYLKSKSIEELKDKNAALMNAEKGASTSARLEEAINEDQEEAPVLLSSEYAILGIAGQADKMSVDLIDSKGQSVTLKVGSFLQTGHIVSEIGDDFVRFSKDGHDDYLYIGRTIDGITPTLGLIKDDKSK